MRTRGRSEVRNIAGNIRGGPPTFLTEIEDSAGNVLAIGRQSNGRISAISTPERNVGLMAIHVIRAARGLWRKREGAQAKRVLCESFPHRRSPLQSLPCLGSVDNVDALEALEVEQILVTRDDEIGMSRQRAGKHVIVIWVG